MCFFGRGAGGLFSDESVVGFTALYDFSYMEEGITEAVNYTQCEISTFQHCAICLSLNLVCSAALHMLFCFCHVHFFSCILSN